MAVASLMLNAAPANDAVLLTIDGEPVYTAEFLYIYNKNNSDSIVEHKTMDEYLDMFINYKLKVHEAKQLGLDTDESFRKELQGYRKQIVSPYMTDSAMEQSLLRRTYQRKSEDVSVSHIAVLCPPSASAEDTLAAFNKISEARQRVTTGIERKKGKKTIKSAPEDFATVAKAMSDDVSAKDNGGHIGWVVPLRFVQSFEDMAYNTPVGEVSRIFRTPFGYHILKVEQRIPHVEVRASHIMKMTPKGEDQSANDSIEQAAHEEILRIYQEVTRKDNALPFDSAARVYSDDRGTRENGGDLNWFGLGRMVAEFETTAFALKDSGDISEPIRSQYGWHIIQKTGQRTLPSFENSKNDILRTMRRTELAKQVEQSFIDKQKNKYNFKVNSIALQPFYDLAKEYTVGDSVFNEKASALHETIISFADRQRTQADFAEFLKTNNKTELTIPDKIIDEKFNAFVNRELYAYEDSQLENEYPEFRNLVAEYHDGILLFNLALDKVWNRATTDTAGLREFFNTHKKDYTFDSPRYKGRILYCRDEATFKAAKAIVKNATPDSINSYLDKRLNTDSVKYVRTEKGLWREGQNKVIDKYGFKLKNTEYEPLVEYPLVTVIGKKLKAPEEYLDVRGDVTTDYQDYLEQEWIKELRSKYKVEVNQTVFEQLKKE